MDDLNSSLMRDYSFFPRRSRMRASALALLTGFAATAAKLSAQEAPPSYAPRFAPTPNATHSTRNDIGLTLGVGFHP